MKEFMKKVIGIETYESENNHLANSNNELARLLEKEKAVNKALADNFVQLEEECNLLKEDPEKYIAKELERRTALMEKQLEGKMHHKWYGIGRQDAYAEMGIKNIEAHERGDCLVMLPNGDIVELITALEDIESEETVFIEDIGVMNIPPDEITIDDLAEV